MSNTDTDWPLPSAGLRDPDRKSKSSRFQLRQIPWALSFSICFSSSWASSNFSLAASLSCSFMDVMCMIRCPFSVIASWERQRSKICWPRCLQNRCQIQCYHMVIAGVLQVKNIRVQGTFFKLLKIAAAKEENLRSRSSEGVQRPG